MRFSPVVFVQYFFEVTWVQDFIGSRFPTVFDVSRDMCSRFRFTCVQGLGGTLDLGSRFRV